MICAPCKTLAAGTVKMFPVRLPKLAGLPVVPEFESLHVADVGVKVPFAASVICTAVFKAVVDMFAGRAGVGVATAVVEMEAGAAAKLVAVKLKVPVGQPVVIF